MTGGDINEELKQLEDHGKPSSLMRWSSLMALNVDADHDRGNSRQDNSIEQRPTGV